MSLSLVFGASAAADVVFTPASVPGGSPSGTKIGTLKSTIGGSVGKDLTGGLFQISAFANGQADVNYIGGPIPANGQLSLHYRVEDGSNTRAYENTANITITPQVVTNKIPGAVQTAFQRFNATAVPSVTLPSALTPGNVIVLVALGDHASSLVAPAAATPAPNSYTSGSNGAKAWTLPVTSGMGKTIQFQDAGVAAAWGYLFAAEVKDWSGGTPQVASGPLSGSGTSWTFPEPAPGSNYVLQLGAVVDYQGDQQTIGAGASILQNGYGVSGAGWCGKFFSLPAGTSGNVPVTTPYSSNNNIYLAITLSGAAVVQLKDLALDPSASPAVMGQPFSVGIQNTTSGDSLTAALASDSTVTFTTSGGALAGTIANHGPAPDYKVGINIDEALPGSTTKRTLVYLPVLPHLSDVTLDNLDANQGQSWSANVIGLLDVSTVGAAALDDGTPLTVTGSVISYGGFSLPGSTAATVYVNITQNCTGADNDGLVTRIGVTVHPVVVTNVTFQAV